MARLPKFHNAATVEAVDRFVDVAFREPDSLFTPGNPVWSRASLDELHECFVENPDESKATFIEKFSKQLSGTSPQAIQLAAELLFAQLLTPYNMGSPAKKLLLQNVLALMPNPPKIPDRLAQALDRGMVSDQSFLRQRPSHLTLLIELLRAWRALSDERRASLLAAPWEFKTFVLSVEVPAAQPMAQMLLSMVHPDSFESITSRKHKRLICEAFSDKVQPAHDDVDRQLLAIREAMTPSYGEGFSFYQDDIKPIWQPGTETPSTDQRLHFMEWARRLRESERFMEDEVEFKRIIAERVAAAKQAALAGDATFADKVQNAFGPPNDMTAWQLHNRFVKWCADSPDAALASLRHIWGDGDPPSRMRRFLSSLPKEVARGAGVRAALASFLLLGDGGEAEPVYRPKIFKAAYRLAGNTRLPPAAESTQQYTFALDFLDRIIKASADMDVPIANRLEAQSVVWSMVKRERPPADWTEKDWSDFKAFRSGVVIDEDGSEDEDDGDGDGGDGDSLDALAETLLLDSTFLAEIRQLLEDKRQVIFYGPPGTGKTYVAQRMAEALAGANARVKLVQFHPSYTYEDFIEGYRPGIIDGQPGFKLVDGPLKAIVQQAMNEKDKQFLLVIDEINRGDLSKVLGELYFLLEYRNKSVQLQYSEAEFRLPENLWLIGTMNTADRSISLVDAALRRRFYFVEFFPDRWPVDGLLRRWLKKTAPEMAWIADLVDYANKQLADRHLAIGPSHFMKEGLTESWVRMIWKHAVIPYVEEQFFGEPDRVAGFGFDALKARLAGAEATQAEETAGATDSSD
ncbi:MAG: McrB family protein [Phycisphaerales bacterium JB054]